MKKDHTREMTQKNTKINNLFTDIENLKTDLSYTQSEKEKMKVSVENMQDDLQKI